MIEKDRSSVKSTSCALLLAPPNKLLDNMLGGGERASVHAWHAVRACGALSLFVSLSHT